MKAKQKARSKRSLILSPQGVRALRQAPLNIFIGVLIGVSAILPGVSGGVLCVVFGIYKPMMSFLSHPVKSFQTFYPTLTPVFVGCLIGFFGLARVVNILFRQYEALAIWLFIGLITGTLPSLLRTAGEKGRTVRDWVFGGVCFTVFLAGMLFLRVKTSLVIEPSFFWWFVCGVLWGVSVLVPGLSASTFLIYLGLYQPLTAGIADISFTVLVPFVIGNVLVVLTFARLINWLFEIAYSTVYHGLFGFVVASMLVIVPFDAAYGAVDIFRYVLCFAVGGLVALLMDKLSLKLEKAKQL